MKTPTPTAPPRHPRNGHSPDCPYPNNNPDTCHICASERKAGRDITVTGS